MQRFGDYLLVSLLGRGGMAEVFRARRFGPAGFERSVVVKRIRDVYTRDPAFVSLFVNEAKVAAQLSHPNIVQVYDFGEVDSEYFIAMEYVRGKDLLWLVRQLRKASKDDRGRMPPQIAAFVLREVCRGLGHAHNQLDPTGNPAPIIHRDVSPQNIMVTYDGQVKLVDFGIAKALFSAQAEDSKVGFKGKYAYMSPEQAAGQAPGPESDVFCAGIVLYEILTGLRLFRGDNDLDTVNRVRTSVIKPPSTYVADVPAELDAIVMKALCRDRTQRYDKATAMARDLEAYLRSAHVSVEQLADWMTATVPSDERDLTNDSQVLLSQAPLPAPRPAPASSGPTDDEYASFEAQVVPPRRVPPMMQRVLMIAGGVLAVGGVAGGVVALSLRHDKTAPPALETSARAPAPVVPEAPSPVAAPKETPRPDEVPAAAHALAPAPAHEEVRKPAGASARPAAARRRARIDSFEDAPPKIEAFD